MFNLHLAVIVTFRLQLLHDLISITSLHIILSSVIVLIFTLLACRTVVVEVIIIGVTVQIRHRHLLQTQLADLLTLEQIIHSLEISTNPYHPREFLLFKVVEDNGSPVLSFEFELDIEHFVACVGVGVVAVVGDAGDILQ